MNGARSIDSPGLRGLRREYALSALRARIPGNRLIPASMQFGWFRMRNGLRAFSGRGRGEVVIVPGEGDTGHVLSTMSDWRNLVRLITPFAFSGYRVRVSLPLTRNIFCDHEWLRCASRFPHVRFVSTNEARPGVHISNRADGKPEASFSFHVDASVAPPAGTPWYLLPYGCHPRTYVSRAFRERHLLADGDRRAARVLFSGSRSAAYDTSVLGGPSRASLLRVLEAHVGPETRVRSGADYRSEFLSSSPRRRRGLCVLESVRSAGEWLYLLSRSDFYLCLPGLVMPMCHNSNEAMAAGAIPILNYAQWFDPPLRAGVDCLQFSDGNDLPAVLDRALAMSEAEVREMRGNVVDYYRRHVDEPAVCHRIESLPSGSALFVGSEVGVENLTGSSVRFAHLARQGGGNG